MEQVVRLDRQTVWDELSIVLMDDDGIEGMNRRYLDRPSPTDVLSFRYPSGHGDASRACGEIIVNVERAVAEGSKRAGASMELALYLAHGCDHLSGQDDDTARSRRRMRQRDLRWLRNARKSRVLTRLLRRERGRGKRRNG